MGSKVRRSNSEAAPSAIPKDELSADAKDELSADAKDELSADAAEFLLSIDFAEGDRDMDAASSRAS